MSPTSKREYLRAISQRYRAAARPAKHQILTEVCATTGYHRKAVIRVLNRPPAAHLRGPGPQRAGRDLGSGRVSLSTMLGSEGTDEGTGVAVHAAVCRFCCPCVHGHR